VIKREGGRSSFKPKKLSNEGERRLEVEKKVKLTRLPGVREGAIALRERETKKKNYAIAGQHRGEKEPG